MVRLRIISGLFIVALLAACAESKDVESVPDHQSHPSKEYVYVQGRNIMRPDSTPLLVKGVSLDGWLSPDASVYGLSGTASSWQMDVALRQLLAHTLPTVSGMLSRTIM